jgi:hypothetical protein
MAVNVDDFHTGTPMSGDLIDGGAETLR